MFVVVGSTSVVRYDAAGVAHNVSEVLGVFGLFTSRPLADEAAGKLTPTEHLQIKVMPVERFVI